MPLFPKSGKSLTPPSLDGQTQALKPDPGHITYELYGDGSAAYSHGASVHSFVH